MIKKLGVILFLMIMILSINISVVMAVEESCKLTFDSTSDVKVGETVELTLKVSDINVENGISAICGLLVYEDEIFEEMTYENSDNWGCLSQLENVLLITTKNLESTAESSDILTIKLKTKSDVEPREYVVKFTKIEVTGDNGLVFNVDDIESRITINALEKDNSNTEVEKDNNEVDKKNNDKNSNEVDEKDNDRDKNSNEMAENDIILKQESDSKSNSTANSSNTISLKSLPKTGVKYGIVIILITIVIVLGIIFYKKYKKYR